jgi:hypothetical protein
MSGGSLQTDQTFGLRSANDASGHELMNGSQHRQDAPARLAAALSHLGAIVALWICALMTVLNLGSQLPARATHWDFSIYYMSVALLHEGQNPYTTDFGPISQRLGLEAGEIRRATDPPTFLLLMKPLALMPERVAYYTWVSLNTGFLALALLLLLRRAGAFQAKTVLVLSALALLYPPVGWHFLNAQSKILLLLLLVTMMRLMERGSERTAGLCLAAAGLLRIFPLLLIGYLFVQRRWTMLFWTLIGLTAGGLITLGLLGASYTLSYFDTVRALGAQHVPWMSSEVSANVALGPAVSRLLSFILGSNPHLPMGFFRHAVVVGAQTALFCATVLATAKLKPGEDPDWRALSLWVIASVLLSPTAWVYYMVLFLIPFAQLAGSTSGASQRAQWAAILSYLVIVATSVPLAPIAGIVYARYGREPARWFMSMMVEGWSVSAILAYLAAYWFIVDASSSRKEASDHQGRVDEFGSACISR